MAFADLLAVADASVRGVLGQTVTYSPGVGDPVEVDGVFDAAYVRVDLQVAGVSSAGPAAFLSLSDLPSDPETDTDAELTIAGTDYTIHEVQKDGVGGVLLLLHRA